MGKRTRVDFRPEGTFGSTSDPDSHGGAVWCLDVDWETKNFVSGAADNSVRLWDVCTGKLINKIETKSAVRTAVFAYSGGMVAYSTDRQMGQPCVINIVDTRTFSAGEKSKQLLFGTFGFFSSSASC